jgi:RNA polymerase sigma-70 factor (ECF subfamily)
MYRVAFSILNNPQDAEDAVHHAFVKIAENIKKIDEPVCLKTRGYVVTIVRNRAIDVFRRKQAHPQTEYCDATQDMQVEYDGDNSVTACIMKLNERQRTIIILKHHYGYDTREIAKMLDITYRNALQIEQRAKAKLRALCEEEGIPC